MEAAPSNLPEYSVSELSQAVKRTVEDNFEIVRVRGEISGFKRHSSGHLYFALKDADAAIDGACGGGGGGCAAGSAGASARAVLSHAPVSVALIDQIHGDTDQTEDGGKSSAS
jgi:hypothetical protein